MTTPTAIPNGAAGPIQLVPQRTGRVALIVPDGVPGVPGSTVATAYLDRAQLSALADSCYRLALQMEEA